MSTIRPTRRTHRTGPWWTRPTSWPRRLAAGGLLLLAAGAAAACNDAPTAPGAAAGGAIKMVVAAATTDFVRCGQEIPVTATATDPKTGRPVAGILVDFQAVGGGGRMFAGAALTNSKGVAKDYWTVGAGANLVDALEVRAVDPTSGAKRVYFADTVTTLSKIAFRYSRGGTFEIDVMNPDGTGQTKLSGTTDAWDLSPAWSPDGRKIAFVSARGEGGIPDIYVMNADGTGQTRLTTAPIFFADDAPAWSPDGRRIAFTRRDETLGNAAVYVINADGSGLTPLTDNLTYDRNPAWSPDGSQIAFDSYRSGFYEIYVMNADGTNPKRLSTTQPSDDEEPAWSPDGRRIAFMSYRDGNYEIYVMHADGSGPIRLTDDAAGDYSPVWSPDGGKIAFTSERSGVEAIYVMNADGSGLTRLTNNTEGAAAPAWSGCTAP